MTNKTRVLAESDSQELLLIREFDLPRNLLFDAYTKPELLEAWMSNDHARMKVLKLENKDHGSWRFVHTDNSGNEYSFNGTIHKISRPAQIIRTFEFENVNGDNNVQLEFLTFEVIDGGKSKLLIQTIYRSVLDRDFMIRRGMEEGANAAHDRLEQIVTTGSVDK